MWNGVANMFCVMCLWRRNNIQCKAISSPFLQIWWWSMLKHRSLWLHYNQILLLKVGVEKSTFLAILLKDHSYECKRCVSCQTRVLPLGVCLTSFRATFSVYLSIALVGFVLVSFILQLSRNPKYLSQKNNVSASLSWKITF